MTETMTIVLTPAVEAGFCTVADIKAFLQIEVAAGDPTVSCERAITEATEAIRNYCRQHITLVEDDAITFDVGPRCSRLLLPELPVVDISSVEEDGTPLVEGADEDYQLGNYGILYRVNAYWQPGVQTVEVTYDHGYAAGEIPQDIIDVCARAASRAYQAGLKAAETEGLAGVQALGLGDYSVTYGSEGGGGVGEGVMGASSARFLLLSEKDMLDRYRV